MSTPNDGGTLASPRASRPLRPPRTRPIRLLRIALAVVVLILGAAPAAHAHTALDTADPADGSTRDGAVAAITLTYTLPVTPLGDAVVVTGPDGAIPVEISQKADGTVVVATPGKQLTNGQYTVDWNVAAQDGHPLHDTLRFSVTGAPPDAGNDGADTDGDGGTASPTNPSPQSTAPSSAPSPSGPSTAADTDSAASGPGQGTATAHGPVMTAANAAVRIGGAAALWGLLVAAGGLVFGGYVLRGTDRIDLPPVLAAVRWTGALILAGLALRLAARTIVVAQGNLAAVVDPGAYADALLGPTLWVFALQAAGAAAILVGVSRSVARSWLATAGTLLAGTGHVLDGHSFAGERLWLVIPVDVAHLAAAATWVGGVVMLGLVLRHRRRAGQALDAGLLGARFSVVASVSVVVLGVAGAVLAFGIEGTGERWTSTWGYLLYVKLTVVAFVAALGVHNHFQLVPRLRQTGHAPRAERRAARQLEQASRAETALLVAVVLITAWLVTASMHG